MDLWRQYLFQSQSATTLGEWAKRLHVFRFVRAYGGHANDGDMLVAVFKYGSLDELREFFEFLGINLVAHEVCPPQPEAGRSYRGDEWKFPSLIPDTKWIEQPGHREIAGQRVFIWCERGSVMISVASDYEVTEADATAAEIVERSLVGAALERLEPPIDSKHCICPKFYPEYFG